MSEQNVKHMDEAIETSPSSQADQSLSGSLSTSLRNDDALPDNIDESLATLDLNTSQPSDIPQPSPLTRDAGSSSLSKPGASETSALQDSITPDDITYRGYKDEDDIPIIMSLIAPYLSEPYSVFCYRYFLHGWPQLCLLAHHGDLPIGVIVCKQDVHRGKLNRGYIAMLATRPDFRKLGIASTLVQKVIATMKADGAQEIILETEVSNKGALRLYQRLGFIREKRLFRFYLNASDAFRLALPIPEDEWQPSALNVPPAIQASDNWRQIDKAFDTPDDNFMSILANHNIW